MSQMNESEFDLLRGVEGLPASAQTRPNRRASLLLGAIGLGTAVTWGLGAFVAQPAPLPAVWSVAASAFGIGLLLLAAHLWRFGRQWHFSRSEVRQVKSGLLGAKEWAEPLGNYAGIAVGHELAQPSQESADTDRTFHMLVLRHKSRPELSVTLYRSSIQEGLEARQRRYADLFGLPRLLLLAEEDASAARFVSVADAATEVPDFSALARGAPGKHLRVSTDGEALRIRLAGSLPQSEPVAVCTIFLLTPPGFLWFGVSQLQKGQWFLGAAACVWGMLLLAISVFLALDVFAVVEELVLSPAGVVHHGWLFRRWDVQRHWMPADNVEAVVISPVRSGKPKQTSIQVVGQTDTIEFAPERRLTREEKTWIRDALRAALRR